jgi:hypothetical protein
MPLRPLLPAILLALVMSIVVGVLAAGRESGITLALAVSLFALQMFFALARTNAPFWRPDGEPPDPEPEDGKQNIVALCVRRHTVLAALVYLWGAVAILAIYSLSSLTWRHWWQYGAAMAVVSAAIFLYAHLLTAERGPYRTPRMLNILMGLTTLQGLAVVAAVVYLLASGKLFTSRGDWAANYVFAAGSITLAVLSAVSIITYLKLTRSAAER